MKRIYFIFFALFFVVGCSTNKSVEELQDEFGIDLTVQDIGDQDTEQIANLDQNQVESLLAHINAFKDNEDGESNFEVMLHEDLANSQIYRIELLNPVDEVNTEDYELVRQILFEISNDPQNFEPTSITTSFNGGGGLEWDAVDPIVEIVEPDTASIEVLGEWRAEFIYDGELITFSESNRWLVNISEDDIPLNQ